MTVVYFVRHAQPNYDNHDDLIRELTEKGLADRRLVTGFLEDKDIFAVLSSPYKRAIDTVGEFAEKNGLEIEIIENFKERKIDSVWIDDFDGFCRKQWEDLSYKLTDGESLGEVQERNISALKDVLKKYEGKNVAIGSHGTALSTIINYYVPSFGYERFQEIKGLMPWIVRFRFEGERIVDIKMYDLFENT